MLEYAFFSEKGEREQNEDCVACYEGANGYLFALCDGLGGHGAGEVASKIAVDCAKEVFDGEILPSKQLLSRIVELSQSELYKIQSEENKFSDYKTTVVLLHIKNGSARYLHIGDSRAYVFKDTELLTRTVDHSVPQLLVMQGEIKDEDIRFHPDRNKLTRVLGHGSEMPKFSMSESVDLEAGMRFLLCTDGLWEWIDEDEMREGLKVASSPAECLKGMAKRAVKQGAGKGMDNISAICVYIADECEVK